MIGHRSIRFHAKSNLRRKCAPFLTQSGLFASMRAYALALLVAMVGVQALQAGGFVEIPVRPFHWLSNITGGLVFGAGMMLGGGCSGSTLYRTGEGAVGAWIILLGFALGATAARLGALAPVRASLQAPAITVGGSPPTLASIF